MHAPEGRTNVDDKLLNLTVSDTAQFSINTLDDRDRRLVTNWFESLRRWHLDDYASSRSTLLKPDEDYYLFMTPVSDLMIAFHLTDDEVIVEAIGNKQLLRRFRKAAQGTGA
jgi:hypothetical protein